MAAMTCYREAGVPSPDEGKLPTLFPTNSPTRVFKGISLCAVATCVLCAVHGIVCVSAPVFRKHKIAFLPPPPLPPRTTTVFVCPQKTYFPFFLRRWREVGERGGGLDPFHREVRTKTIKTLCSSLREIACMLLLSLSPKNKSSHCSQLTAFCLGFEWHCFHSTMRCPN